MTELANRFKSTGVYQQQFIAAGGQHALTALSAETFYLKFAGIDKGQENNLLVARNSLNLEFVPLPQKHLRTANSPVPNLNIGARYCR